MDKTRVLVVWFGGRLVDFDVEFVSNAELRTKRLRIYRSACRAGL